MSCGSSMLTITYKRPLQRTHCSISIPNTCLSPRFFPAGFIVLFM
jgi:hypothetical protein